MLVGLIFSLLPLSKGVVAISFRPFDFGRILSSEQRRLLLYDRSKNQLTICWICMFCFKQHHIAKLFFRVRLLKEVKIVVLGAMDELTSKNEMKIITGPPFEFYFITFGLSKQLWQFSVNFVTFCLSASFMLASFV